jgi:hypothetical protein
MIFFSNPSYIYLKIPNSALASNFHGVCGSQIITMYSNLLAISTYGFTSQNVTFVLSIITGFLLSL